MNVVCVNADSTPRFARDVGPDFLAGRHTVGYWFWEIEQFPTTMHAAFDVVDEVWAATDFIVDAVRAAGRKPVFKIPLPIAAPRYSAAFRATGSASRIASRFCSSSTSSASWSGRIRLA